MAYKIIAEDSAEYVRSYEDNSRGDYFVAEETNWVTAEKGLIISSVSLRDYNRFGNLKLTAELYLEATRSNF